MMMYNLRHKVISYAIPSLLLLSANSAMHAAENVTVTARLDSVAILMGKQTRLHYNVVQDKDVNGFFIQENPNMLSANVEIYGEPTNDTTDLGNNRIEIDRTMIVQSFDSGVWEIPAAKYIVGHDTVFSNALNLKVIPVDVDSLSTVHDFKATEGVPFNLFDYLPDFIYNYWWLWLIVIALAAGITYLLKFRKKHEPVATEIEIPKLPPYEEAIEALNSLKAAKLWQSGQEKEYFTRLTDILRRYLDRRFGINAIEMTSSQIIESLRHNEDTRTVNPLLKQILEVADFVKFANMRPLPDDSEAAWNRAEKFVNDTKPVPQPEASTEATETNTPAQNIDDKTTDIKSEKI